MNNDILNVLQEISNNMGYLPTWISVIGVFIPILLSLSVLIMQILHQKSNKSLQEKIYNHEVDLKFFDSILDIYSVFSKSVDSLPQIEENIKAKLIDDKTKKEWSSYLIEVDRELYRKYDFSVLLLGKDNSLTKVLYNKIIAYDKIITTIKDIPCGAKDDDFDNLYSEIKQYMSSMDYENFDKHFSKYININNFMEK